MQSCNISQVRSRKYCFIFAPTFNHQMTKTLFGHKIESSRGRFLRLRRWEQRELRCELWLSRCYWGLGTADVEWHGGCGTRPGLVVTMLWSCFGHSEAQWRESPTHVILCQLPWEMIFDFQIQIGKLLTDWETGPSSKTAAPSARVAAPQFCLNTDCAEKMAADQTRSQAVVPPAGMMEPLEKLVRTKLHWHCKSFVFAQ